ncbi:MAG: OmpH family outer membrane protein [Rhodobacterales bacterium]
MFFLKNIILIIPFFYFGFTNSSFSQIYPIYNEIPSIAVVDQEALFRKSKWGKDILNQIELLVSSLNTENETIKNNLELEELILTEKRKIVSKSEFNVMTFDFDLKVKKIRTQQADKQNNINSLLNNKRALFFKKSTPILLTLINDLGVEVLLNKDMVALASLKSDITQIAIKQIDEILKD